MASTWYYYNEQGERIGVTGGQLKELAKTGLITPETIIETENGKSAPARKVKGLTFGVALAPDLVPDTEVYGLSKPKPPVEVNPFTVATPVASKPIEDNPFTAAPLVGVNSYATATPIEQLTATPLVSRWAIWAAYAAIPAPIFFIVFFSFL